MNGDIPLDLIAQMARETGQTEFVLPRKTEARSLRPDVQAVAQAYLDSPDRLHGDGVSQLTITSEKPIHRVMIFAHARGATINEIAKMTGYTVQAVTLVLNQPWARERLVQILKETGMDEIKHFHKTQVMPALQTLQEIRDNPQARHADRIAASREILDRALGKSTIHVESNTTIQNIPVEVSKLDQELAAVRKQLAAKGVHQPSEN